VDNVPVGANTTVTSKKNYIISLLSIEELETTRNIVQSIMWIRLMLHVFNKAETYNFNVTLLTVHLIVP